LLFALLPVLVAACVGYHPPSPHGYHYDRGQAMARSDTRVGRLIYYSDADDLAALSQRIEANCGFTLRRTPADGEPARRDTEFVQGYNSVSVPVIEEKLGAGIEELIKRCGRDVKGAGVH
jgi:hypothetical protein